MCPRVTARGGGHKKTDHVFHSSSASVHWIMTSIIYLLDSPPCVQAPNIRKAAGICFKGLIGKWERKICPEATVTSSSTFDLKGQMFSQPSADCCHLLSQSTVLHLCALLCGVKLPDSHGKDVPSAAKPAQGGLFQKDTGFFLRRTLLPACPASM